MGGNATKHLGSERIDRKSYEQILEMLSIAVHGNKNWESSTPDKQLKPTISYRDKQDFGDCDLVSTISPKEFEELISKSENIHIVGIVHNGLVVSYAMRFDLDDNKKPIFQVDLIRILVNNFNFAYNYYSYNDLGNFLGRVVSALGYKLGFDGLHVKSWFNQKGQEVHVSDLKDEKSDHATVRLEKRTNISFDDMLKMFDYSPERFHQGFQSLEDVMEYVTTSKYFHPDFFQFQNRTQTHAQRDKKRPNYIKFLEYIKDIEIENTRDEIKRSFKETIKREYFILFQHKFMLKKKAKRLYYANKKLSSNLIRAILNKYCGLIPGQNLEYVTFGEIMKFIKANYDRSLMYEKRCVWNLHISDLIKMFFEEKESKEKNGRK